MKLDIDHNLHEHVPVHHGDLHSRLNHLFADLIGSARQHIRVVETSQHFNRSLLFLITQHCKHMASFIAINYQLPVMDLSRFPVSCVFLHVGSIDINESSDLHATAVEYKILHNRILDLKLEHPMNATQIKNLFLYPILGLTKLHITGLMSNRNIERIKVNARYLRILIVSTTFFDLGHLSGWKELADVEIKDCVHLRFTDAIFKLEALEEFTIENAVNLTTNQFYFLVNLKHISKLVLRHAPSFTVDHLRNCNLHKWTDLQHLDLSYTAALVNNILEVIWVAEFRLTTFLANYPFTHINENHKGFSDEWLIVFLKWPGNSQLQVLGLAGHIHLTGRIFERAIDCMCRLHEIDISDCNETVVRHVDRLARARQHRFDGYSTPNSERGRLVVKVTADVFHHFGSANRMILRQTGVVVEKSEA
jgi:hypothetical protein